MAFGTIFHVADIGKWRMYAKNQSNHPNNRISSADGLRVIFVYSVPYTRERVLEILSHKNAGDRLPYEFDRETIEICFTNPETFYHKKPDMGASYQISFKARGTERLMYVEQKNVLISGGAERVQRSMNEFWSAKVNAVPYNMEGNKQ